MKKISLLTSLFLSFALPLFAQQPDTLNPEQERFKRRFAFDIIGGGRINFYNFDDMNRQMNQAGLANLEAEAYGGFFAMGWSSNKSGWASEYAFEFLHARSNGGKTLNGAGVTYRDYGLYMRVMYDVLPQKRLTKVAPFVGLGVIYRMLRTYSNIPPAGSFVPLVTQEVRRHGFENGAAALEVGLALEQGFKARYCDVFIGVRGGYALHTLDSEWALDGDIITDLPNPSTGLPFVAMTLRFSISPEQARAFRRARRG